MEYKPDVSKIGMEDENAALPLSGHYQNSVLGWMEVDENFFKALIDRVESNWFIDIGNTYTFDLYKKWWAENKSWPQPFLETSSPGDIESFEAFTVLEPKKKSLVKSALIKGRFAKESSTKEVLLSELEAWLKSRLYHKLIHDSSNLYNKGKFKECYATVRQKLTDIEQASFGASAVEQFSLDELIDEQKEEHLSALTFGVNVMDGCLLENAKNKSGAGSLIAGDTTIILGGVNTGKTTVMITVAAHNIWRGKKVLYITHEGRKLDIKMRVFCAMLKVTKNELIRMWGDPKCKDQLIRIEAMLNKYLLYVPMMRAGGTVEETVTMVRTLHNRELGTARPIDLYIDDYPGTITTIQAQKGNLNRRDRDDEVYGQIVTLAGELQIHALCAIQTNREGAKINKNISEKGHRLIQMEDVSESYGPMMRATNVISINRDPIAQTQGFVTFNVCKSRGSKTGVAVVCKSRYDLTCTHSNFDPDVINRNGEKGEFGSYCYEGTEAHSSRAAGFLAKHMGGELNTLELLEAESAGVRN